MQPNVLDQFFAPLGFETFMLDRWEQSAILFTGSLADTDKRLSVSALELKNLLGESFQGWGKVQLAHSGPKPREWIDFSKGPPNPSVLSQALGQGDTVILNDVQGDIPSLAETCSALESAFHFPVNVNCYITPKHSQGLDVHYDMESVFVLQVSGVKRWRVFAPERIWPEEPAPICYERLGEPLIHATLAPGDLLYIPRGYPHDAMTLEEESVHLTFAVSIITWKSLVQYLIDERAISDPRLRQALPAGFVSRLSEVEREVDSRIDLDQKRPEIDRFVAKFLDVFRNKRGAQCFLEETPVLELDCVLFRCPSEICHVFVEGEIVHYASTNGHLTAPAALEEEFQTIATSQQLIINDISPKLSSESKLRLASRFVKEGILFISRSHSRMV